MDGTECDMDGTERDTDGTERVPSLLSLTISALLRPTNESELRSRKRSSGDFGGSFFGTPSSEEPVIILEPLPLPVEVKMTHIRQLRIGGMLGDAALLRLTDASFSTLNLS